MPEGYSVPPLRTQSDDFLTYAAKQRKLENKPKGNEPKAVVITELQPEAGYGNVGESTKSQLEAKSKDLTVNCKIQEDERDGQAGALPLMFRSLTGNKSCSPATSSFT